MCSSFDSEKILVGHLISWSACVGKLVSWSLGELIGYLANRSVDKLVSWLHSVTYSACHTCVAVSRYVSASLMVCGQRSWSILAKLLESQQNTIFEHSALAWPNVHGLRRWYGRGPWRHNVTQIFGVTVERKLS